MSSPSASLSQRKKNLELQYIQSHRPKQKESSCLLFGVKVLLRFLLFTTTMTTIMITASRRNKATPTDTPTAMARTLLSLLSAATPPEGPTVGLVGTVVESFVELVGAFVELVEMGALYTGERGKKC